MKRILSVVCAIALALSLTMGFAQAKAAGETKKAYVTIEKLTIGQGLLVQPTSISISDDDTITTIFKKAIKNADSGTINIPSSISNMQPYDDTWGEKTYNPPTNDLNDGNDDAFLGEHDYNYMAGWMFACNNTSVYDMSSEVKDGDVIRVQFSVFGWGNDIGLGWDEDQNAKLANKDALIKRMADIQEDPDALAKYEVQFNNAKSVLAKYDATQDEVDAALSALSEGETTEQPTTEQPSTEQPTTQEVTTTAAPETTTGKPTIGKAKIKSIKNVKKRRAKITVVKLPNAKGYIFKYSKYKSFKKAKKKDTTKTSIKTKKFKKKQTCYAKVQSYVVKDKVKYFGKWSKVKKVKIKK